MFARKAEFPVEKYNYVVCMCGHGVARAATLYPLVMSLSYVDKRYYRRILEKAIELAFPLTL
jgi:hypothetical protein